MRVEFIIDATENCGAIKFVCEMPARLNKGDLVNLDSFITEENEDNFTEAELDVICELSFGVNFVCWDNDENGVFQRVFLDGE